MYGRRRFVSDVGFFRPTVSECVDGQRAFRRPATRSVKRLFASLDACADW
jgi:hypothetical protein